jgi:hypothetical protein
MDRIIVLNDRKISPRPLCSAKCQIRTRLPFILEMFTKLSSSVLTSPLYRTPPKTPARQCNASGACGTVRARFLARWRQKTPTTPLTSATTMPTAKVAPPADSNSSLLIRRQISPLGGDGVARQAPVPDDRRAGEHRRCPKESLPRICGDVQPGPELSHDFTHGQDQDAAREDEEGRRVRPLQNAAFCAQVEGLKQDQSAVEAAVEQSWSNGPVEGHINRLKTLKRQMYGRAGFELLRARVLPLPPPAILHQE